MTLDGVLLSLTRVQGLLHVRCVTGDKARKGGEGQIMSPECHAIEFGLILE